MIRLPFYLVDLGPWPMTCALSSMFIAMSLINFLHFNNMKLLTVKIIILMMSMLQWW